MAEGAAFGAGSGCRDETAVPAAGLSNRQGKFLRDAHLPLPRIWFTVDTETVRSALRRSCSDGLQPPIPRQLSLGSRPDGLPRSSARPRFRLRRNALGVTQSALESATERIRALDPTLSAMLSTSRGAEKPRRASVRRSSSTKSAGVQ